MDEPNYTSGDDYVDEETNVEDEEISSSDEELDADRGDPEEDRGDPEEYRRDQNEEIGNVAKKKTRGLTRLVKLHNDFRDSKGKKRVVEFDQLGRSMGKYRAEFSSYLGDLVRHTVGLRFLKWKKVKTTLKDMLWDSITLYYEIDVSRRKQIMCHLGEHLRDFRRKLYTKYIQPNIGQPKKLKVVPKPYEGFVEQKHWDAFVEWRLSPEFKDVSKAAKQARAKAKYPHRLGRSGYTGLREKLVKNKELAEDEVPKRSFMWRKARESKDGEYKDEDVRNVANEITCHEKEIAEGSIKLDDGTDALTLVFGKDHNGRVTGVGKGVTPTKYWHIPRRRGTPNERISQLEKQLDAERQLRESKNEEFKLLSTQMQEQKQTMSAALASKDEEAKRLSSMVQEQGQTLKALLSHLASQGITLPQFPTTNKKSKRQESLRRGMPSSLLMPPQQSTQQSSGSREELSGAIMASHINLQESENMIEECECQLAYPNLRNIVACGKVYYSSEKQMLHGVALDDDYYKVSISKAIKAAAFLPIEAGEHKTVGDAIDSFVAWPKSLVITDLKVADPISDQHDDKQTSKKRKKNYISASELQKVKHMRSNFNKKKANMLEDE